MDGLTRITKPLLSFIPENASLPDKGEEQRTFSGVFSETEKNKTSGLPQEPFMEMSQKGLEIGNPSEELDKAYVLTLGDIDPDSPEKPQAPLSPQKPSISGGIFSKTRLYMPDGRNLAEQINDLNLASSDGNRLRRAAAVMELQMGVDTGLFAGSMANLGKITELPYSLYIFGYLSTKVRAHFRDEDDAKISEESGADEGYTTEYIRISEAIRMASVMHNLYYGGNGLFEHETPWYGAFVRYAIRHGIIWEGDFLNYNDFATRAEAAYIFSNSVPISELPDLNHIPALYDVPEDRKYYEHIIRLFRAGVVIGSDKHGSFHPGRLITREEAAEMIGRIAVPADRKKLPFASEQNNRF